jgi:putative tricarboxylic transport membrane protein
MNNPSGVKAWLSGERITALLFLGLVAIYGWEGSKFTAALQVDVVGPSLFPRILTVAGLLLGLILLIKAPRRDAEEGATGVREHLVVLMPVLLLLGYSLALEPVGFPLATAVFLAVSFKYFGQPSWKGAVLYSLAITVSVFALFYYGLDLKLPLGPLKGLV